MSSSENDHRIVRGTEALTKRIRELEASERRLKHAEAELQASGLRYRTLFENTGAATILIEEDTTIAMANAEFEKLTGYSRSEIEGKMSWAVFIHPDDREWMLGYHQSRRRDPDSAPRNYECRLMGRTGRLRTCYSTVAVLPETSQSIASFIDLTEARAAEHALKAQEEQYRLLVETMSDGLGVQDEHGIVTYVNHRICEILGFPREELIGRRAVDLLAEASKATWQGEMIKRKVNRHEPYELKWRKKSGELVDTIVSPRPITDAFGRYMGSFAVFTDITDRKKAEEALLLSEEKFGKAFQASPAAIAITTLKEGLFLEVNDSFLRVTGYDRSEVVDHTSLEIHLWPSAEFRRNIMLTVEEKGGIRDVEVDFRVKSGEERKIVYSAEAITLQGVPCLISLFTDVTEERRLEREIIEIGERERQKIGRDLHDDLQQHLIGVEAQALLLENRLKKDANPHTGLARETVSLIREATAKTRALARGMSPVYIDEAALFTAIRDLAKGMEAIFGVSFRLDVARDVVVRDNAVAVHIFRIVQEAVNNAIRHGHAGHIAIALRKRKDGLSLSVTDDGTGMPEDFDRKKGMGLNIMRHRARMIGAGLSIRKNPRGGVVVQCLLAHGS